MNGLLVLAFVAGMVAPVNPCGFALLPAWISITVGNARDARLSGRLARGAAVGLGMALGFAGTLTLFGLIVSAGAHWLVQAAPWIGVTIGVMLILLAASMAIGYSPHLRVPSLTSRRTPVGRTGIRDSIAYGAGFATASLSCTFGALLAVIAQAQATASLAGMLVVFAAYAAGSAVVLLLIAVLAVAGGTTLTRRVSALARHGRLIIAGLLAITGAYLAWYWYPATTGTARSDETLTGFSSTAASWIQNHATSLTIAAVAVALALSTAAIAHRTRTHTAPTPSAVEAVNKRTDSTDPRRTAMPRVVLLSVPGIHCGGCATSIQTGLSALDGVESVAVDTATKEVTIRYNDEQMTPEVVIARLKKLGFPVAGNA